VGDHDGVGVFGAFGSEFLLVAPLLVVVRRCGLTVVAAAGRGAGGEFELAPLVRDQPGSGEGHGLRTAWSDKHPAYEILNVPSGNGVQDLFTPEINSSSDPSNPAGKDWTADNAKTRQYDAFKAQAFLSETTGTTTPAPRRSPSRPSSA
jgi:hypothetical protein